MPYMIAVSLEMSDEPQYDLTWTLNDNVVDRISLNYGDEIRFSVFCSLENLHFIGDSLSSQKHFALFEKVKFEN